MKARFIHFNSPMPVMFMTKISHSKLESCKLQCFILVFVKILCFYYVRYVL